VGGQVRQYGNYSFSRVYQAGSAIEASQPETAFQIFQRAIFGLDIAKGIVNTEKTPTYSSKGALAASRAKQDVPEISEPFCYSLEPTTCSDKAWREVYFGTGMLHQYILIDEITANLFPGVGNGTSSTAGKIDEGDDSNGPRGARAGADPASASDGSALPNSGLRSLRCAFPSFCAWVLNIFALIL
jgi:hypothetical protein